MKHFTISPVAACYSVVKGRLYSVYIHRLHSIAKNRRWSLRSTLDLDSDKSLCFNHRDKLDSTTVQLPNFKSVVACYNHTALYTRCVLYYIHSQEYGSCYTDPLTWYIGTCPVYYGTCIQTLPNVYVISIDSMIIPMCDRYMHLFAGWKLNSWISTTCIMVLTNLELLYSVRGHLKLLS